jgi:hypothetical protein
MKCVSCKEPMVVLELQQVEIDYCLECGGIWLDVGELGLLLRDEREARELLAPIADLGQLQPGQRKCPICLNEMERIRISDDKPLEIDRCKETHGLWFDRGELRRVVRIIGGQEGNKIANLLEDMFRSQLAQGKGDK